jgi:UDP-N-acetylmuramyl pentapeptide phosphotransferase/UDP-N-acetylglucosamine-1-phosphate transferase
MFLFTVALLFVILCIALPFFIRILNSRNILDIPGVNGKNHSHKTARGAGISIIITCLVCGFYLLLSRNVLDWEYNSIISQYLILFCLLAIAVFIFFIEDIIGLPVIVRFGMQIAIAVTLYFIMAKEINEVLAFIPYSSLRFILVVLGYIWFMNLYNFMDGIDLITALETLTIIIATAILTKLAINSFFLYNKLFYKESCILYTILPYFVINIVIFAFFNKPTAKIFLGDCGSIGFGILIIIVLTKVAYLFGITVAIALPLYYLLDSTITLFKRIYNREKIWLPNYCCHFYQKAKQRGLSNYNIIMKIFLLNVFLTIVACIMFLFCETLFTRILILTFASIIVVLLLCHFNNVFNKKS